MSTNQPPGLQYPEGFIAKNDNLSRALKMIVDNLFYLRGQSAPVAATPGSVSSTGSRLLVGNLSDIPTLTDADANQVEYFAIDYGHTYLWVGQGVTSTGWLGVDYCGDQLVMKMDGDSIFACQPCDGSTVNVSTVYGQIRRKQVPLMNLTDPVFIAAAAVYSGSTPLVAVAPTVTSATGTASAVSTVGGSAVATGTTGPGTPHSHGAGALVTTASAGTVSVATLQGVLGHDHVLGGITGNNNQDMTHQHGVDDIGSYWNSGVGTFSTTELSLDTTSSVASGTAESFLVAVSIHSTSIDVDISSIGVVTAPGEYTGDPSISGSPSDLIHDHDLPTNTGGVNVWDITGGTIDTAIPSLSITGSTATENVHTHDATLTVNLSSVTVTTTVTINSIDVELAADGTPTCVNLLAYWRR